MGDALIIFLQQNNSWWFIRRAGFKKLLHRDKENEEKTVETCLKSLFCICYLDDVGGI